MERALGYKKSTSVPWRSTLIARIVAGMLTVGGMSLAVKALAVVKGSVVARQFGIAPDLDSFYLAFLIPSFLSDLLAGAIVVALVPVYVRTYDREGHDAAQKLFGRIILLLGSALVSIALILWLMAPRLIAILGSSLTPDRLSLTTSLFDYVIPTLPLSGISALFIAVLTAKNRLALATIAPGISTLTITVGVYVFAPELGIHSLVIGTTVGVAVQTLVLLIILRKVKLWPRFTRTGSTALIKSFCGQLLIVAAGSFIINFIDVVDQYSASTVGPGKLSALNYGNKFVLAILGPASMAVSTAVLPHMSEVLSRGDFVAARRILKTFSGVILAISVPLTLLLVLWSPIIVRVLFQRNAFTSNDTVLVASVQRFYLLQIPVHVLGMLLVSLVWSLRANWVFLIINPVCLALKIFLNGILVGIYGVAGIGLATSIVYSMSCALLLVAGILLLRREEQARHSPGKMRQRLSET